MDVLADFARTLLRDYQVQEILDQLTGKHLGAVLDAGSAHLVQSFTVKIDAVS